MSRISIVRFAAGATLCLSVAGVSFVTAQSDPGKTAPTKVKVVNVPQLSQIGAAPRPGSRVSYMSEAQCVGLGGVVTSQMIPTCKGTGKICTTADSNGVMHFTCITEE